ncbi:hypothetical protein CERSUDRAFT_115478 [Gelatoporia subvermispora B]|uniref:Uncharacterized protein n=1 Tax=Ceriporiopsis subvermispora (strain B) TaxID=914234 RepID=M2RCF4_CERS8|nr:hypothetical protein CERSUDRAFT_115478 [Gelatoporia subvermispora B]
MSQKVECVSPLGMGRLEKENKPRKKIPRVLSRSCDAPSPPGSQGLLSASENCYAETPDTTSETCTVMERTWNDTDCLLGKDCWNSLECTGTFGDEMSGFDELGHTSNSLLHNKVNNPTCQTTYVS